MNLKWYPLFTGTIYGPYGVKRRKRGLPCKYKTKGVYLIRENGIIVYIGQSGHCIKKRCYRKFEAPYSWRGTTALNYSSRIYTHTYEVAFIPSSDQIIRNHMEAELIKRFDPRDNNQVPQVKYEPEIEEVKPPF